MGTSNAVVFAEIRGPMVRQALGLATYLLLSQVVVLSEGSIR